MKKFLFPILVIFFASCDYIENNYYECTINQVDTTVVPINTTATNSMDYIDLGLPSGNLWATRNIGASMTSKSGTFFSWGDTLGTTTNFVPATYWDIYSTTPVHNSLWGDVYPMKKYYCSSTWSEIKYSDEYDICQKLYGEDVHTPSYSDFYELFDNCSIQYDTVDLRAFDKTAKVMYVMTFRSKVNQASVSFVLHGYMSDLTNITITESGKADDGSPIARFWTRTYKRPHSGMPDEYPADCAYVAYLKGNTNSWQVSEYWMWYLSLQKRYEGAMIRPVKYTK